MVGVNWNITGIPSNIKMAKQPLDLAIWVSLPENYSVEVVLHGDRAGGEAETASTDNSVMKGRRKKEQLLGETVGFQRNHTVKGRLEENKANLNMEDWPSEVEGSSLYSTEKKMLRMKEKETSL